MKAFNYILKIFIITLLFFHLSEKKSKAQCLDLYTSTSNTQFADKKYYSDIFNESSRTELLQIEKQITSTELELKALSNIQTQIEQLTKKAESDISKRSKRKLYAEIEKKQASLIKSKIDIYNKFNQSRVQKYKIYNNNIQKVRYSSKIKDTREARNYEYKATTQVKNAQRYRSTAEGKPMGELIKDYVVADSLQTQANLNLENAFGVYFNDSPADNDKRKSQIEEYKKYLETQNKTYQSEIEALLKGREPESWMKRIDYEYKKYKNNIDRINKENEVVKNYEAEIVKLQSKEKREKDIRNYQTRINNSKKAINRYKKDVESSEQEIIRELGMEIKDYKVNNQKKFNSYNEAYARYYSKIRNTAVEKAEKEILDHLTIAKEYIYKAEFSNKCVNSRLKIYSYLLQANFHEAEAMDKLVAIQREHAKEFLMDKTMLPKTCVSDENNNFTSSNKSKNSTTKKTSSKTSYSSGSKTTSHNKWKYANKKGIKYKVQILAQVEVPSSGDFKGLYPISSQNLEGSSLTAYLVGTTTSMYTAEKTLASAKKKGFKDAYVVAYNKYGKRIPLWEAEDIINGVKKNTSSSKVISSENSKNEKITGFKQLSSYKGVLFTVQVAYSNNIPTARELKYLDPVYKYDLANGYSRYSVGLFRDYKSAEKESNRIRRLGISDAFVTAYENGVAIELNMAIKKQN